MSRFTLRSVITLGVAAIASASHAGIVNPSFEDVYPSPRDPSFMLPVGWNTVVYEYTGYESWDGAWADQYDAYINSGIGPTDGRLMAIGYDSSPLWQTVTLTAGDTILVDVAAATSATASSGWVGIAIGTWTNYVASSQFRVPPERGLGRDYGWLDWQTLSLTVPATGTYDLMLMGGFGGTADGGTNIYFDNIRLIPAPGAAAMLVLGGAVATRRRR